jgi:ABC-2 type transport system ATP-binding protein
MTTHNMPEVEQVCDRVAILCRGRLIALDSPLALRMRHAERLVDVVLADGSRQAFDLDDPAQRERLTASVSAGRVASMRTREFDFHQAFLKLTGTHYE